jgi:hypothetical protein
MSGIHYHREVTPEDEWTIPADREFCGDAVPQGFIDDWIFEQEPRWFPSSESGTAPAIDVGYFFREHSDRWAQETAHLSSPTQMMMNPNYQAIMGMAQQHKDAIVRLMLIDLRDKRRLWFWALNFLTHENPVSHSQAGKLDAMIGAWINWGKEKDII